MIFHYFGIPYFSTSLYMASTAYSFACVCLSFSRKDASCCSSILVSSWTFDASAIALATLSLQPKTVLLQLLELFYFLCFHAFYFMSYICLKFCFFSSRLSNLFFATTSWILRCCFFISLYTNLFCSRILCLWSVIDDLFSDRNWRNLQRFTSSWSL